MFCCGSPLVDAALLKIVLFFPRLTYAQIGCNRHYGVQLFPIHHWHHPDRRPHGWVQAHFPDAMARPKDGRLHHRTTKANSRRHPTVGRVLCPARLATILDLCQALVERSWSIRSWDERQSATWCRQGPLIQGQAVLFAIYGEEQSLF